MSVSLQSASAHVFTPNRPNSIHPRMDDFIVVSLPDVIKDRGAVQQSTIDIELFARNKAGGLQDVPHLDKMLSSVLELFPFVYGRFSLTRPSLKLQDDDGTDFGVWLLQARVLTNMTDQYKF